MKKAAAAVFPLLLMSACAASDVSLKTKVNSYTVPDEMTTIQSVSTKRLIEDMKLELEWNEKDIETETAISMNNEFKWDFREKSRRALTHLEGIRKELIDTIAYAESSTLDEESGRIQFTYIKTDVNGIKSTQETKLHCMKRPEGSPEQNPLWMMLVAQSKIDHVRNNGRGDFIVDSSFWTLTQEQKDLEKLSKKLCRRYFSFDKGDFYLEGQLPSSLDK